MGLIDILIWITDRLPPNDVHMQFFRLSEEEKDRATVWVKRQFGEHRIGYRTLTKGDVITEDRIILGLGHYPERNHRLITYPYH